MKNKQELRKIIASLLTFIVISLGMSYCMNIKINALEEEKSEIQSRNNIKYKGDCSDPSMDFNEDIVIKIIDKMDSSLDINFINKFDEVDENNNKHSSIQISVSGDLDKVKEIESVLNDLKLNYKIESMDIKSPQDEKGKEKNYVDCVMTFKVI